jgi:hypothetical protein
MIRKVRHLVSVLIELKELSARRFNALGGYARKPSNASIHRRERMAHNWRRAAAWHAGARPDRLDHAGSRQKIACIRLSGC